MATKTAPNIMRRLSWATRTTQTKASSANPFGVRSFTSSPAARNSAQGGSQGGGKGSPNQGAKTYKQAFEAHQRSTGGGMPHPEQKRTNLNEHRKTSAERFSGAKRSGALDSLKGKRDGGVGATPTERPSNRRTPDEMRAARESLDPRRGPVRGGGMAQSVTAGVSPRGGLSGIMEKFGEDRLLKSEAPAAVPRDTPKKTTGSYMSGQARAKGQVGKRREQEEAPAPSDENIGLGMGGMVDEDMNVRPMASQGPVTKRRRQRVSEDEDEDKAGEAGALNIAASVRRVVDSDLEAMGDEVDELGEDRLVEEARGEGEDISGQKAEREAELRRMVAESLANAEELQSSLGLVEALPTPKRKSHMSDEQIQRAILEGIPRPFTYEELAAADERDDIINEASLTTPSELEEEQDLMETNFVLGKNSDISLHSERGIFYGVVDMFDRIVSDKQRMLLARASRLRRFQLWRAQSWDIRKKKFAARKQRKLAKKKAAFELRSKNEKSDEMVYYPEIDVFLSKDELRNDTMRNAVSAILSNPSLNRENRRKMVLGMQSDMKKLETPLDPKTQQHLTTLYHMPKPAPSDDPRTIEHLLTLPITDWTLLLAQAERSMDPKDRLKRFDPSPAESRKQKL